MKIIATFTLLAAILLSPVLLSRGFIANAGDLHLHYYPLKHFTSEAIISGDLPLWNPYTFGGTPHLANPQAGVFYPGNLLFYFFGSFAGFKLWTLFHLVMLSSFLYALYKRFIDDEIAAAAGAAIVSLSSFVIYMITAGHSIRLAGFAWVAPVSALAVKTAVDKNRSPSAVSLCVMSLALTFQFLSGHPQGVFMSILVVGVIFAVAGAASRKGLIFVAALFAGLSAAQYLPSAEFGRLAETIAWRPLARAFSQSFGDFISLVAPWKWGNPLDGPLAISYSHFFERKNLFMGYSGLLLALSGAVLSVKAAFGRTAGVSGPAFVFAAWGLLGMVLAFGFNIPGFGFIFEHAPFVGYFRTPSRFYFLTLVSSGFFAAMAVSMFRSRGAGFAVAAIVCAELVFWNIRFIRPVELSWGASPASAVVGASERIFTTDEIPANLSMMTRLRNANGYDALILRDYYRMFYSYYRPPSRRPSTFLAASSAADIYKNDFPGWGLKYVLTTLNIPAARMLPQSSGRVFMYEKKTFSPAVFVPRRVETIELRNYPFFDPASANPLDKIVVQGESRGANKFSASVDIVSFGREKIKLAFENASEGTLALGETYYPGWLAWIDGKPSPVRRAGGIFRAIEIPSGSRKMIMVFMPVSLLFGVCISAISAAIVISFVFAAAVKLSAVSPPENLL
ncbi:MAG: hypothetical protein CVU77_00660 [Elusimicrobia bacterium HGW-Elusimicrobia-1]|jgi:hypothetical protein|nr:MAG: hypothetical protein CVU77_00660 [Elusimicrobia bacterium HGW-Elusimicrobia-1]